MFKLKIFLNKLKFFKNNSKLFARSNNARVSKSVILDSKKTPDIPEKMPLENINNDILVKESQDENNRKELLNEIYKNHLNEQIETSVASVKKDTSAKSLNFDSFKNRNLQLNNKNNPNSNLNSLQSKTNIKNNIDENQLANSQEFDEKLISQLNKYIKEEGNMFNASVEGNKQINEKILSDQQNNETIEEELENKFDGVLVKRPPKGFVWGMGNQTNKKKYKFEQGVIPTVDSLVKYLQACNLKDIIIVPTKELGFSHLKETSIISVGFSAKHIYKSAKDLSVEIKNLKIDGISENMLIYGRRDEEWLLLELGADISIYFMTEAFHKEVDLVDMWTNKPSDEDMIREKKLKDVFYKNHYKI